MKIINKIGIIILSTLMAISAWSCADENEAFKYVHDTNTISQMLCMPMHGLQGYIAKIYEYNKDGEMLTGSFAQSDVEGGYGLILFAISKSLEEEVALSNIYLVASLSYDEFIMPSLSGRHDITGDGIIITVKSGVGTIRQYRVRGYYE